MAKKFLILMWLLAAGIGSASAQNNAPNRTRILILFDCSGSMWAGMDGTTRIEIAKRVVLRMVDSLEGVPNTDVALRCYGNRSPKSKQDCRDTRLEVPFMPNNHDQLRTVLKELKPNGTTPIAYSLTQAATDFPNMFGRNIIILVTDGIEECGGDPCAVSQALQSRNVILKPFIIGVGLNDDFVSNFECVGRYYNAKTEKDMREIFSLVLSQALNNTTVEVQLLDQRKQHAYTNVGMTFYNARNGMALYNLEHTNSTAGNPDSFVIDPVFTYDLEVHTTPPIIQKGVSIAPSKHTVIKLDAAQGDLQLGVSSSTRPLCLVRKAGTTQIINVQEFNTTFTYLAGKYDLEVLTLPRTQISGINILPGQANKVEIPVAGKIEMSYPKDIVGAIYVRRGNDVEWVANLSGYGTIRKEFFYLQPGTYQIVYRLKNSHQTLDTRKIDVKVLSGGVTPISLN